MSESQKKNIDLTKFKQLYMAGYVDKEMAKVFGVSQVYIWSKRQELELPSNQGLFAWQKQLRPSEFEQIPEKYRDAKLCARAI